MKSRQSPNFEEDTEAALLSDMKTKYMAAEKLLPWNTKNDVLNADLCAQEYDE